jgi:hypothetical protein
MSTPEKEQSRFNPLSPFWLKSSIALAALLVTVFMGLWVPDSVPPVQAAPPVRVFAIPAFARKYGLPCSACHEAWPKLNSFGQAFRDNGYQLGNDRDAPIWQNPSYFPISFRITPNWHRESSNNQTVDAIPGENNSGNAEATIATQGFDLSGLDIWTAGTLYKNISFVILPSSDPTATFHFESAFVRLDNLFKTRWLNLKFGKFELDNLISEKRLLFLSQNAGFYQVYHYLTFEEQNAVNGGKNPLNPGFGIGDNQLGVELSGHSANSYTRYSVALLSSTDGNVNLPNGSYDGFTSFSQAFDVGRLGLQRVGAFAYFGQRPTYSQTVQGVPVLGAGLGAKSFYRAGLAGDWYLGKFDFSTVFVHGWDNAFLGTGTPANQPLPAGAQAPTWNGGFIETHYSFSPQLIFVQREEIVRVSRQAFASDPSDLNNINVYSFGCRWYPFMSSRAGLAVDTEYAITKTVGVAPVTGANVWTSSTYVGFDFAF